MPMHRPLAQLEDISEYSDDEEYGTRKLKFAPEQTKRQRVAPAAAPTPTPLQAHVMHNRPHHGLTSNPRTAGERGAGQGCGSAGGADEGHPQSGGHTARPMPPPPSQPQLKPPAASQPVFKQQPVASQPQFKQPHLPSRVTGAPSASGRGGRAGTASSSRFGALNIKMS